MKLITAIVNKADAKSLPRALIDVCFAITRLSTTGGFVRAGDVTLLSGLEDEKVDACVGVIADHCRQRTEVVPSNVGYGIAVETAYPMEVTVGGATVFVTNVERFEKL